MSSRDVEAQSSVPVSNTFDQVKNLPMAFKLMITVMVVVYFVGTLSSNVIDKLALIPGNILPPKYYLWNVFTGSYFHTPTNYFELLISILVLLLSGTHISQLWGKNEFLKYIFSINLTCTLFSHVYKMLLYTLTSNLTYLFSPGGGFFGAAIAITVAYKQLNPEKEWQAMFLSIRAKHLPLLFLCLDVSLQLLLYNRTTYEMGIIGLVVSWIYLRYFQIREGSIGDQGDHFRIASFFPEILQGSVDTLAVLFSRLFIWKSKAQKIDSFSNYTPVLEQHEDAERRRRLALKVLDEQLAAKKLSIPPNVSKPEFVGTQSSVQ